MSSKSTFLIWSLLVLCIPCQAFAKDTPARLLFTGDILLSREVQREITLKHEQSPWLNLRKFFKGADWVMGNFEGSIGLQSQCVEKNNPLCFAVLPKYLNHLKQAGFTAVGIENNHIADLGYQGRAQTREALQKIGIPAVDFAHSPGFFKIKNRVISVIALTQIAGKDGVKMDLHSHELRQKIRLAKALSDWVIITVHWGVELADWPSPKQQEMAHWLIKQGVDVIIGHHPHVIQAPECILGHPVFFSLGNHVFDQKYPESKRGLIAECHIHADKLVCSGVETQTPNNSSFPEILDKKSHKKQSIQNCTVTRSSPLEVNQYVIRPRMDNTQYMDGEVVLEGTRVPVGHWTVAARNLLSLSKAHFTQDKAGKDLLFTLENHLSDMDDEISPRPYVYAVSPRGLIARWRGSALAWPLIDAVLMRDPRTDVDYLCALHRKDAFISLNVNSKGSRTAVYSWNGFGFSGVGDLRLEGQCGRLFGRSPLIKM